MTLSKNDIGPDQEKYGACHDHHEGADDMPPQILEMLDKDISFLFFLAMPVLLAAQLIRVCR